MIAISSVLNSATVTHWSGDNKCTDRLITVTGLPIADHGGMSLLILYPCIITCPVYCGGKPIILLI